MEKKKKKVGWEEEGAEEVINWTVATSPTPTPIPTLPAQYIGYVRTKRVSSIFSWCFEPHSVTSGLTDEESYIFSWCFEPSQPHSVTSGLTDEESYIFS